jgi:hypothetical protein
MEMTAPENFAPIGAQAVKLTEDHMESWLAMRRARSEVFGKNLFADTAWDMLIVLYYARLGGSRMTIAEVSSAIDCLPASTVRWVAALKERNLVITGPANARPQDQKITLTEDAAVRFAQLAGRWASAFIRI